MQWYSCHTLTSEQEQEQQYSMCKQHEKQNKMHTLNYCTADILPTKFEEGCCPPAQGEATKGLVPMTSPRGSFIRSSTSLYNKKKFWKL